MASTGLGSSFYQDCFSYCFPHPYLASCFIFIFHLCILPWLSMNWLNQEIATPAAMATNHFCPYDLFNCLVMIILLKIATLNRYRTLERMNALLSHCYVCGEWATNWIIVLPNLTQSTLQEIIIRISTILALPILE